MAGMPQPHRLPAPSWAGANVAGSPTVSASPAASASASAESRLTPAPRPARVPEHLAEERPLHQGTKPTTPGPGRPAGSRNETIATRHDVGERANGTRSSRTGSSPQAEDQLSPRTHPRRQQCGPRGPVSRNRFDSFLRVEGHGPARVLTHFIAWPYGASESVRRSNALTLWRADRPMVQLVVRQPVPRRCRSCRPLARSTIAVHRATPAD
jgi:hypothetical protein